MKPQTILPALSALILTAGTACGHGVPVDVLVDSNHKLVTSEPAYEGEFNLIAGVLLTTDLPGIGVASTANGLAPGDVLGIDVVGQLLYFDGSDVVPTPATLIVENFDASQAFFVTNSSGIQTGMFWGTYDGSPGWDEHGSFTLEPASAAAGVYGLALKITSPAYAPSDPFLLAFSHGVSDAVREDAINAFLPLVVPEPSTQFLLALGAGTFVIVAFRSRSAHHALATH